MTFKRIFDAALAGVGLLLAAPLSLVLAAAIRLEDGGPIFFGQPRAGQKGRPFMAWKFRSMRTDAESLTGPLQARVNDPRVTRVGRVMRATAMDELPQLWNILRGDMSFVGPRALRPGEIESEGGVMVPLEEVPGYASRIQVRPGLTGVAQVFAPRDISRRNKFRYDRVYVKSRSRTLDLRLILISFYISLRGTWESRGSKY